jgi:putative transposase
MPERIRKRRKVFQDPGHGHYLTYSCANRWPLLTKQRACLWVIHAIEEARQRNGFDLHAFVIMPEHVHLLIRPRRTECDLARVLYDLKRPVSWKARQWLAQNECNRWIDRLTFRHGSRKVFRFWLPGGGFDRNILQDRSFAEVVDYIHGNPVRRGLVSKPEDWTWSSAGFWAGTGPCVLKMDPVPT